MIRTAALFAFSMLMLVSCGSSDRKEIDSVLSQRQRAYETKNVELYLECISPAYSVDKDGDKIDLDKLKKQFENNVSVFDEIQIRSKDRNIYIEDDKANVRQRTDVRLRIDRHKSTFRINENLVLAKSGGKWRITKESDADFFDGFVYGGKR